MTTSCSNVSLEILTPSFRACEKKKMKSLTATRTSVWHYQHLISHEHLLQKKNNWKKTLPRGLLSALQYWRLLLELLKRKKEIFEQERNFWATTRALSGNINTWHFPLELFSKSTYAAQMAYPAQGAGWPWLYLLWGNVSQACRTWWPSNKWEWTELRAGNTYRAGAGTTSP